MELPLQECTVGGELFQECFGVFQICGAKPFGEPAVEVRSSCQTSS